VQNGERWRALPMVIDVVVVSNGSRSSSTRGDTGQFGQNSMNKI
jgi:hypothetical protein